MAYQLIWTAEADSDFHSIMHYLRENWSVYSAQKFAERTIKKLDKIAAIPYQPKFTSQPTVQMIKLDRKNVLFFTVENNNIILLSIYPYKKDITKSSHY